MKNSKEWFSIKELMDENLNLPSSDKGIVKKAEREGWKKRQRDGVKGKTFEYHYSSLPKDVQKQLGFETAIEKKGGGRLFLEGLCWTLLLVLSGKKPLI